MRRILGLRPTPALRLAFGAALLALLAYVVDVPSVAERLAGLDARWVGAAVGISVLQTLLSAWRWRYTAGRLGLDLPMSDALGEYYRSVFINQVLPGGVVGDASRAWRHASRARTRWGAAVRAVLLERASGQVAMAGFAAAAFVLVAPRLGIRGAWAAWVVVAALVVVGVGVWWAGADRGARRTGWSTFLRDARQALFVREALAVHAVTSSLIVGSYVVAYLFAARAVGVLAPFAELAPLVPPVLLAMLVPLSVGGWGVREGAAAGLWAAVGMQPAEGVAISVAYGLIVLLGTLPGAYLLAFGGLRSGAIASGAPAEEGDASSDRSNRMSSPRVK